MRRWGLVVAGLCLTSCTSSTGGPSSSPSHATSTPRTTSTSAPPSTPSSARHVTPSRTLSPVERALARMTLRQRVGQLLMVDCPTSGLAQATQVAIQRYAVGGVILDGTSYAGASEIGALASSLQRLAPKNLRLLISTDQEGGVVQRLQGPGFTRIPAATVQGTYSASTLYADARQWGRELRTAGVNVNLAPVLDVVPIGFGTNPPIGDLDREFGHTPTVVGKQGVAVARGLQAAGVAPTVKHFPGLGRVHGNTDLTSGVSDYVTTANDPYLSPFRTAVRAGVPFVMISTAIYAKLDPGTPAAFSARIVTGLLRRKLGFRGLVISDDVGGAQQVAGVPVGDRAVRFIRAGGDVVLTVDATQAGPMTAALFAKATTDPAFRKQVDDAVLRVLQEKQRLGLLR